ncbi:MAG: CHAT domain-containing protein, partial [Myxococcota bacterium]
DDAVTTLTSVSAYFGRDAASQSSYDTDLGWLLLRGAEARQLPHSLGDSAALFQRARDNARLANRVDLEANALTNLAWASFLRGDVREARSLLAELDSLDPDREMYGGRFAELIEGHVLLADNAPHLALRAFEEARQQALLDTAGFESEYSWRAAYGMAKASHALGATRGVLRYAQVAITSLSEIGMRSSTQTSHSSFIRDRVRFFADAIRWALDAEQPQAAFVFSSNSRTQHLASLEARLRLERLSETELLAYETLRDRYLTARDDHETLLRERDLVVETELQRFDATRDAERRQLKRLFEEVSGFLNRAAPRAAVSVSAEDVQESLLPDEALISTLVVGSRHLSFLLRHSEPVQYRWSDTPATLDLWENELEEVEHLYIVPGDDESRSMHRTTAVDHTFWLSRFSISYVPFASIIRKPSTSPSGPPKIWADPSGNLPHALREGRYVSSLIGASLWTGEEVSRHQVLSNIEGSSLFHFAGHGRLEADNAWDAHLELARGERLTVEDLLIARPQIGVVVLTSCETGDTDVTDGLSIADAFLIAGATAVLAADGTLSDDDAFSFVSRFYRHGGVSRPVTAYQLAALEEVEAGREDWRSFRVIGLRK